MLEGEDVAVIAAGPVVNRAFDAAIEYRRITGKNPSVYNIRYIKPIDTEILEDIVSSHSCIITIEDGCTAGGLHGAVAEYVISGKARIPVRAIGIPDRFIGQGTQGELRQDCGLYTEGILKAISEEMQKSEKKE